MKICVFSDIHGNSIAWENMYRREKNNVDKFFFLGDIYGYFYDQSIIIKQMMADDRIIAIKGNHDEYYIKYFLKLTGAELKEIDDVIDYSDDIWSSLVKTYGSSYRQKLDKEYKKYLLSLTSSKILEIDGKRIGLFHGGPEDQLEQKIYPDTEILASTVIDPYEAFDLIFTGHTHCKMDRMKDNCRIINPGSLGLPDINNGFSYCIYDTVNDSVEFKEVDVDLDILLTETKLFDEKSDMYADVLEKYKVFKAI